ncbi:fimbrial protein [Enterobacter sp. ENT03]|uniref:fimbrial protein n=1 Tax=Enterobacter sp. ENT03 TaxID=2854780 RepID=UPI001C486BB5|nr:fimbrial protein [Enterobacter sp. ENT03]MBV7407201.1 type 1 fimbrial protein [Enterobacter sp. ENT03]
MKKLFKTALATVLVIGAASSANAENSGKVTFKGSVINDTCDISINGQTGTDFDITFPASYPGSFVGGVGAEGAAKTFTMDLVGCEPGTLTKVSAAFTGAHSTGAAVLDTTGTAQNVGIKLYSKNGGSRTAVMFDGTTPTTDYATFGNGSSSSKKNASLKYEAVAIQKGATAVSVGDYQATADYELVYQ